MRGSNVLICYVMANLDPIAFFRGNEAGRGVTVSQCLPGALVHLNFVFSPGNPVCSGEDRRLKILRNCPRKEIVGVVGCPSLRACVSCSMLIEHVRACKHMKCRCGKEFCFICLKPKETTGWKCGGFSEACTIAPVQTKIPGEN